MDLIHNVNWQVSLSNGETFFEGKGKFAEIPNEPSPWQKLIRYTAENRVLITSLSLITTDNRTFNLPSAGKSPKFREFSLLEAPIDYQVSRHIAREHDYNDGKISGSETTDWFTVAEAIYPDYKLQVWVDEKNTKNSWVLVVKI